MDRNPESVREDIAETQSRMGETVEALAYKTDLPSRARDAVNDRVEAVKGKVSDTLNSMAGVASHAKETIAHASAAVPSPSEGLRTIRSAASDNPLGLAIGSIAIGFLIGLILPVSDIERERVGRLGERMTEQAKSAASDVVEQGKAAVTQVIGDAVSGGAPQAQA